jgi:hypothetical protein
MTCPRWGPMNRIHACLAFLALAASACSDSSSPPRPWTKQFGTSAAEYGRGVASGPAGEVFVTGWTTGNLAGITNQGRGDVFLVKYDAAGTQLWTRLLGSSEEDDGVAVATDADGNVVVAGRTEGGLGGNTNGGGSDMFVAKYAGDGTELWVRQIGESWSDAAHGVATDPAGNVFVGGTTNGALDGDVTSIDNTDVVLIKLDPGGAQLWLRQLGGSADDVTWGVATDASGNAFVAGYTGDSLGGSPSHGGTDAFVVKIGPDGTRLWTRQFGTAFNDEAVGVATDTDGNVVVSGRTEGDLAADNAGVYDAFVVKFDPAGTQLWARQVGGALHDTAYAVATDPSGNVCLAGTTSNTLDGNAIAGGRDGFIVKYDAAGGKLWLRDFGSPQDEDVYGVAVDGSGNAFVAGQTTGGLDGNVNAGGSDAFVLKYDAAGNKL